MVLSFRHLEVDDDILYALLIETIPEKSERDPIG
jgi:hypothetical protein